MFFKNSQHSDLSMMQIFTILHHWHMDSTNFWTNIFCTFKTIVFSFILFLLFPFLAWCSYWCFICHSLHPKNSALLLLATPGEIWKKKKIIQITDMISSLPSHILPCSQLGLSYIIYTAIYHCLKIFYWKGVCYRYFKKFYILLFL